jgi:hypothetical protein
LYIGSGGRRGEREKEREREREILNMFSSLLHDYEHIYVTRQDASGAQAGSGKSAASWVAK